MCNKVPEISIIYFAQSHRAVLSLKEIASTLMDDENTNNSVKKMFPNNFKLILCFAFAMLAMFVYMFWLSGSHGHVIIRSHNRGDIFLAPCLLVSTAVAALCFILWTTKRKK